MDYKRVIGPFFTESNMSWRSAEVREYDGIRVRALVGFDALRERGTFARAEVWSFSDLRWNELIEIPFEDTKAARLTGPVDADGSDAVAERSPAEEAPSAEAGQAGEGQAGEGQAESEAGGGAETEGKAEQPEEEEEEPGLAADEEPTPEQRAAMAREELFAAAATILARPREEG